MTGTLNCHGTTHTCTGMALIHLKILEKNSHHKDNRQTYEVKYSAVTHETENVNLLAAGSGGGGWSKRIWPTKGW